MNQTTIKTILDAKLSRERVKSLFVDLIKVHSPQTDLLEEEPLLKEFIRTAIEPRLRAMGFGDIRYDLMGNLVANVGADSNGRSLLFVGHAMNQPPATMQNPYAGDVIDGKAYGLPGECVLGKGASEQKSNIAAMLHAMESVLALRPDLPGRLTFICALSGETGKHDAIRSAIEHGRVTADMAVLYGNSLKITLGNRGRIDVFVTVRGEPCHSSRPQTGANAITGAMEAIRLLTTQLKLDKMHPHLGNQTLTVNRIKSYPESTHTVQERCEFTIDRRLLPGDDPGLAFEDIRRALEPMHAFRDPVSGKGFGIDVRLGPFMYPSLVTTDSPVVRAIQDASSAMLGREAEVYYASAAFDQGYLNHIGIPTANYGPGEERFAHTDNDMASIERTFDATRVYAYMILRHLT
jgi:acetylornithine deacetylase/succinyl-diaminopimelate desuccinylase-like protein